MGELYIIIEELCKQRGVTITKMCKDSGASRGSLTDLKKGRKQSLSADTLSKIAAYFDVSVDFLLNKKSDPAASSREVSDDDIKFALFEGAPVTDEQFEEVKRFARYIADKYQSN